MDWSAFLDGFGVVTQPTNLLYCLYLTKKTGFEPGPLVLAFVLGSLMESSFRRSMLIFEGDPTGFVTRPISGTILAFLVLVLALP